MRKIDIKNFTLKELEAVAAKMGYEPYRARQIFFWLCHKRGRDLGSINNLPNALVDKLVENYYAGDLELSERKRSHDETEKFLFRLPDGNFIESVLIRAGKRKTVCISTQVGCKFACSFCASGQKGFIRNLTPSEITNQILYLQSNLKHKITNYVFMGMGEPLDNYDNVAKTIMIMNDSKGMNIGARRITISSCGIISGIRKLKGLGIQVNLSISLHAATNELRNRLAPVNKTNPLENLIEACEDYINHTGRLITLEYVLLKNVNDSAEDAAKLAVIAKRLRAKVNLIPYSEIAGLDFKSPSKKDIDIFMNRLIDKGVNATLRHSKGKDIQAACGQLACRAAKK